MGTKFYGQFHVAESLNTLSTSMHVHKGEPLKSVMHVPPLRVLDQEDLFKQDIDTSALVKGALKVDALGSCTANATTVAVSFLGAAHYAKYLTALLGRTVTEAEVNWEDVKTGEEAAILFYHLCSDQTGVPSQEWPPTDCGSSGPYIVQELQRMKLVSGASLAQGAQNIVSLLQTGPLLVGQPFLNDWESPASNGMIDGDGSAATFEQQVRDGVAGGHETLLMGTEKLVLSETGQVVANETIVRFRNSWSASWGDKGDYLAHLSTYVSLASNCDYRLLTV